MMRVKGGGVADHGGARAGQGRGRVRGSLTQRVLEPFMKILKMGSAQLMAARTLPLNGGSDNQLAT